jgi:hypothetical protein
MPILASTTLLTIVTAVITFDPLERTGIIAPLLALAIPSILFVIAVHELGHVAAGVMAGYRLLALIVGPLACSNAKGRLRVEVNPSWSLAGGIAVLVPQGVGLPSRGAAVLLFAGGPFASILLAAAAFALRWGADFDAVRRSTVAAGVHASWELFVSMATLLVGAGSAAIAIATLLPQRIGGFTSDGASILILLRGGERSDRLRAISSLLGRVTAGIRPREWSADELRAAARPADGSPHDAAGASMILSAALDRGDLAAAREAIERMRRLAGSAPSISSGELHAAEAFIAAIDGDASAARAALGRIDPTFVEGPTLARIAAAVLLAEGRDEDARAEAQRGRSLLDGTGLALSGFAPPEHDWLTMLAAGRMPLRDDRPRRPTEEADLR